MIRLIDIHLSHEADVGQLREVFFDILETLDPDELGPEEDHQVVVTKHDVFGQTVTFCLSCSNPNTSWDLSCEVREKLIARIQEFQKNGATMFPDVNPAEGA